MRIAIDATPAAVQQGGVGRYTRELIRALVTATLDHRFILATAAPRETADDLLESFPPGAWREIRHLPASERVMTAAWHRLRIPLAIDHWTGRCDIFHGPDYVLPPTRAAKVVTVHDLSFVLHPEYADPRLAAYLNDALPRAIARTDVVITVSAAVAAETAALFPDARDKIVAIPNGVRLPVAPVSSRSSDPPVILMVGTIEPRKNHLAALTVLDIIRDRHPDVRLYILGRKGWLADEIESRINDRAARGSVTWLRNADDRALEQAYAGASVVLAPSHYEGFGLPVLEAMARGVPVVASDILAHREVAGDTSLFASPDRPEALGEQVLRALEDSELRRDLSERGRVRSGSFSWGETARRVLRVYERLGSGAGVG